jgi:hypothetical protein
VARVGFFFSFGLKNAASDETENRTRAARSTDRATGNLTVVPIVKSIGLGLGLLIWGLVGMLVGWASGHFGVLGVAPDPPLAAPWLNYAGVVFAAASLGVYANITSEVP